MNPILLYLLGLVAAVVVVVMVAGAHDSFFYRDRYLSDPELHLNVLDKSPPRCHMCHREAVEFDADLHVWVCNQHPGRSGGNNKDERMRVTPTIEDPQEEACPNCAESNLGCTVCNNGLCDECNETLNEVDERGDGMCQECRLSCARRW